MQRVSSGVAELDVLLGGLIPGDNVVWVSSDDAAVGWLGQRFLEAGRRGREACAYVTTSSAPATVRRALGSEVAVLDARPGHRLADPMLLEQTLVERARTERGRVVFDGLDALVRRWGPKRTLGLFTRVCPQFFDLGAIGYWLGTRQGLGKALVEDIQRVTQCVLDIGAGHLRVIKAEGRPDVQGRLLKLRVGADGAVQLEQEKALGRLSEGLRRLRRERHLSQAELARLAGVSPSAISQAEAGHRGLGLDTLLTLSEATGLGIDDLLANRRDVDHFVARRERPGPGEGQVALLDDPSAGLRAYLVVLRPGEHATPPVAHKGVELILVASGLVQVDLGTDTPVLRSGDAILATRATIAGWRNLLPEPARLFWILRD